MALYQMPYIVYYFIIFTTRYTDCNSSLSVQYSQIACCMTSMLLNVAQLK